MQYDLNQAHQASCNNKSQLLQGSICGCFYCLKIFSPAKIKYWVKDELDETATCTYCGIDAVIGEKSGYPVATDFLLLMKKKWF